MPIGVHPTFAYDEDSSWTDFCSWLTLLVRGWVYNDHIPCWQGQEIEVINDIVSESLEHIFERLTQISEGRADPINNFNAYARKVAHNCFVDQKRKDKKKVRFSQITATHDEEAIIGLVLTDMEDVPLSKVYFEQLFNHMAQEVIAFPRKQKEALLRDHARRLGYMTNPALLLRAYASVGIPLSDYLHYVPADEAERRRHSSLLHCAYRRLCRCPEIQKYISGIA